MSETEFGSETSGRSAQDRLQEHARKISSVASDTWDQTRQRAVVVRERTEFFLRENPVPTVLGALALGLAIGLAIRYSSRPEEPTPFGETRAAGNRLEHDLTRFLARTDAQCETRLRGFRRGGQGRP